MPNPRAVDYRALHEAGRRFREYATANGICIGRGWWATNAELEPLKDLQDVLDALANGDLVEAAPLRAEVEALRAVVAEVRSLFEDGCEGMRERFGDGATQQEEACWPCEWNTICDMARALTNSEEVPHE